MLENAEECLAVLEGVSLAAFLEDKRMQLLVERLMEIVGEAAGGVSEPTRARIVIDWQALRGLRHILAHQYGHIDAPALLGAIRRHLPNLIDEVRQALA